MANAYFAFSRTSPLGAAVEVLRNMTIAGEIGAVQAAAEVASVIQATIGGDLGGVVGDGEIDNYEPTDGFPPHSTDIPGQLTEGYFNTEDASRQPYVLTDQDVANGTTLSVPIPPGEAGDELLVMVYRNGTPNSMTTPTGWTVRFDSTAGLGNVSRMWAYTRTADGTEGSTLALAFSGSGALNGAIIARIYNTGGLDDSDGFYRDGNTGSLTIPALTTTDDFDVLVAMAAVSSSTPPNAASSGMTQVEVTSGVNPGMAAFTQYAGVAGDTGTRTFGTDPQRAAGFWAAYLPRADAAFIAYRSGSASDGDSLELDGFQETQYPAAHAYWRISITLKQNFDVSDAREVELLIGGVDQATGGTATANNEGFGSASSAFDNNQSTRWTTSTNGGTADYIQYQLATPAAIEAISYQVNSGGRAPKNVNLSFSDDGSSWTVQQTVTNMSTWVDGEKRTWDLSTLVNLLESGDELFLVIAHDASTGDFTVPDGFDRVEGSGVIDGQYIELYRKRATADEVNGATFTITPQNATGGYHAQIIAFDGRMIRHNGTVHNTPDTSFDVSAGASYGSGDIALICSVGVDAGEFTSTDGTIIENQAGNIDTPALLTQYKVASAAGEDMSAAVEYDTTTRLVNATAIIS